LSNFVRRRLTLISFFFLFLFCPLTKLKNIKKNYNPCLSNFVRRHLTSIYLPEK